jgi:hypothetical protein
LTSVAVANNLVLISSGDSIDAPIFPQSACEKF